MRLMSFLLLAFMISFAGCGGDEYTTTPTDGDQPGTPGAEQPGTTPEKTEKPKPPPMSELAKQAMADYHNVKAINDEAQQKERAEQRVARYESQTIPADAAFWLALLYNYAEDWGKAAEQFQNFVRGTNDPNDRNIKSAMYYTVTTLAKDGQLSAAADHLKAYEARYPDATDYIKSAATTVARGQELAGEFESAATAWASATKSGDDYAGERWVRCLWAIGEYDKARTHAAELATKFADHKEADRYSTLNALAQKMGKPARKLEVAGWSTEDPVDVDALKGNVQLVYVWALKNLGSAKKIDRILKGVYEKYAGEPLRIIGISRPCGYDLVAGKSVEGMSTEDEVHNLQVWADERNFGTPWPLGLSTDPSLGEAYGYRGKVPAVALVGKKGNLRYFRDTNDEAGFEIVKKVVERLLDE